MVETAPPNGFHPLHTFILKVASGCNINCSYCFIYNQADSRWKSQPKLMSFPTAARVAERIRDHCEKHNKERVSIVYHGGEPLLGGPEHIRGIADAFDSVFAGSGIDCSYGMQSNGLLLSPEILDILGDREISLGISCDGPPRVNDLLRVDHRGRSTSNRLEEKLQLLLDYRHDVFSGFLSVINLSGDPCEIYDYLMGFRPKRIDFLLPYDNHSRYPEGKASFESSEYGEWLARLYDHWIASNSTVRIRWLASLIQLLLGGYSLVESIGLDPVDLVVVETNGEIEAVDSLKAAVNGATWLGFNVFDNSFEEVLGHAAVIARQTGLSSLCNTCRSCDYVSVCGAGYLPNRFSNANGFDNPTVYCHDMMFLIDHIRSHVMHEIHTLGALHEC